MEVRTLFFWSLFQTRHAGSLCVPHRKSEEPEARLLLGQTDVGASIQLQQCSHVDTCEPGSTHTCPCVCVCVCGQTRPTLISLPSVVVQAQV